MSEQRPDNLPQQDDEAHLKAVMEGDPAATESFVRQNMPWMLSVARRILRDHALAEDAVQASFVDVFRGLVKFEGRSSMKTWIHRIVINRSLTMLRKEQRVAETDIDPLLPVFDTNGCRIEDDWATLETPESLLQKSEVRGRVVELIDRLPENYRIIVTLRDIEELSIAEVAAMLELSEGNVKVRLHRARAALKKLLEPLLRGEET